MNPAGNSLITKMIHINKWVSAFGFICTHYVCWCVLPPILYVRLSNTFGPQHLFFWWLNSEQTALEPQCCVTTFGTAIFLSPTSLPKKTTTTTKCSSGLGFWLFVLLHCVLVVMSLLLWQTQRFIKLFTEVSVELQPLPFLFIQQEAVDVGEQLIWAHGGDEALPVHTKLVQEHHAEVGSRYSECLSVEKHNEGYLYTAGDSHTALWKRCLRKLQQWDKLAKSTKGLTFLQESETKISKRVFDKTVSMLLLCKCC